MRIYEQTPEVHFSQRDWSTCSRFVHHYRFNVQQNTGWRSYVIIKKNNNIHFDNEYNIHISSNIYATNGLWPCLGFANHLVLNAGFTILRIVGANLEVSILGPLNLLVIMVFFFIFKWILNQFLKSEQVFIGCFSSLSYTQFLYDMKLHAINVSRLPNPNLPCRNIAHLIFGTRMKKIFIVIKAKILQVNMTPTPPHPPPKYWLWDLEWLTNSKLIAQFVFNTRPFDACSYIRTQPYTTHVQVFVLDQTLN